MSFGRVLKEEGQIWTGKIEISFKLNRQMAQGTRDTKCSLRIMKNYPPSFAESASAQNGF